MAAPTATTTTTTMTTATTNGHCCHRHWLNHRHHLTVTGQKNNNQFCIVKDTVYALTQKEAIENIRRNELIGKASTWEELDVPIWKKDEGQDDELRLPLPPPGWTECLEELDERIWKKEHDQDNVWDAVEAYFAGTYITLLQDVAAQPRSYYSISSNCSNQPDIIHLNYSLTSRQ
ncbi:hypothetical protein BGX38DRAFT_1266153 [Terfezia claveryi]|nr:hypothetical protein BGX38DRAFT_1266153 [Terfezia claveryi]